MLDNIMITKNKIKYVQSLHQKKFRLNHQSFIVEGAKNVLELLNSDFEILTIFASEHFYKENRNVVDKQNHVLEIATEAELTQMGTFATNNASLALVKTKQNISLLAESEIVLVLDDIRDPGNLGGIIRIADWYGIKKIVCSENTVDFYNPKVIAATMGSFARVKLYYTDLLDFLTSKNDEFIGGALLNGDSIYSLKLPKSGYLVIGNESNGISEAIQVFVNQRITIPRRGGAESLNASIATAVILDNFFRD
jgi:RNA methyltransferase, TrmH family